MQIKKIVRPLVLVRNTISYLDNANFLTKEMPLRKPALDTALHCKRIKCECNIYVDLMRNCINLSLAIVCFPVSFCFLTCFLQLASWISISEAKVVMIQVNYRTHVAGLTSRWMDEITLCTKGVTTLLLSTLQQVTQQPSVHFFLVTVLAQFKGALPLLSVDKPQEMLPVRRRRFHGDI